MGKSPAKRRRTGRARGLTLATWHRRLGVVSALVVVWLAVTGILLGHTEDLDLGKRYAGAVWLLDWYGVAAPERVVGYRVGADWVSQMGERIYFNDRPLAGEYGQLLGAVAFSGEVVAATGAQLLVLMRGGVLVEVLGSVHGVPRGMRALGIHDRRLVVGTENGDYAAAEDLAAWQSLQKPVKVEWSRALAVPEDLRARLIADYRGRVLTLERVLQDLHSGRLFGRAGVLVMDLAAIAFLALAASGLWLWLLRNNHRAVKSKQGQ